MIPLLLIILIGVIAQFTDGTLGMGYGVTSATALLALGFLPAVASASIHTAQIFTSLVSGGVHYKLGNVRSDIATPLTITGVIGGVLGAYTAVTLPVLPLKTMVSLVLLIMGVVIVSRFIHNHRRNNGSDRYLPDGGQVLSYKVVHNISSKRLLTLGGVAGFIDAIGGGGWGPIATSNLVLIDDVKPREAVGSVNFAEFFQTVAVSATFIVLLADLDWLVIGALILGGVVVAPFAAILAKKMPHRVLGLAIGGSIMLLSVHILIGIFGVF